MGEPNRRRPRSEPWPWMLAGLLALMITGSLSFFAIASVNPDPLVVDDVWEAGKRYNAALAEEHRARDLGVSLAVTTTAAGDDAVRVEVRLTPAAAATQSVHVRRERPAEGGFDAEFALERDGEVWAGSVPLPRRGRWRLTTTAHVGDSALSERTLWWQPREGTP